MKEFQKALRALIETPRFSGNQRALALFAGIDRGLLNRVLDGSRDPTPEFVGRLCGTLPAGESAELLSAFLGDIVAETNRAKPAPLDPKYGSRRGRWRQPLTDLTVELRCRPKRRLKSERGGGAPVAAPAPVSAFGPKK